jgi:hypothetical protein
MAFSKKWVTASYLLRFLHLSAFIAKLYPIAVSQLYPNISRTKIDALRNLLVLDLRRTNELVRFGDKNDGGYLLIDDLRPTDTCLSFGIGSNYSFDSEISQYCEKVLMFDHTIQSPVLQRKNMFFHRRGISDTRADLFVTLDEVISDIPVKNDVILKIDVEGAEWKVFREATSETLLRCRQIVAEFHDFHQIGEDNFFETLEIGLKKLSLNHSLVNVHVNNWAKFEIIEGILLPDVIEVTYVRKQTSDQMKTAPQPLSNPKNTPNNPTRSDVEFSFISVVNL